MKTVKIGDKITELDGIVRIEPGPRRKREVATKELLSEAATASHYYEPFERPATSGDRSVKVGDEEFVVGAGRGTVLKGQTVMQHALDAQGKPIRMDEPFDYIDWRNRRDEVFYIYRLEGEEPGRWRKRGRQRGYETFEEAMTFATDLVTKTEADLASADEE